MRLRLFHAACLSALLLGLAWTLYKVHFPPGPIADEAAYVMMTQSIWHDHDLVYRAEDLQRAYRIWDEGPIGVVLGTPDRGKTVRYAKPFVYSLAAVPFYALLGVQGLVVFNMALFLAMLWSAWWFWRKESGHVGLFVGGFFFASAAFSYVFWMQPEVFNMACVFFPLLIWQVVRRRPAWGWREHLLLGAAGVLLAAAYVSKEPTVLLGAPIFADLLWPVAASLFGLLWWRGAAPRTSAALAAGGSRLRRLAELATAHRPRWTATLALAAPLLVGLALMFAAQRHMTGGFSPYRGMQRRSFEGEYPFESRRDPWELYPGTSFGSWSALGIETTPRQLARNVAYFFAGRYTGLLPYFPFALFALALYLRGPRDRSRHLLLAAIAGYCVVLLLLRPNNYHGGQGFLGNRYFASVYPALLFLPGRIAARRTLLLPYLAAGLWTASVVAVPLLQIAPAATLQAHVRGWSFQKLPLELTLIRKIPGYAMPAWGDACWVVPKYNFYAEERHPRGMWVRGASRSEVVLVSAAPISTVRFTAYSLSDDNLLTLDSGVERVTVRFDSEAKRQGTPVALALRPAARDLGFFPDGGSEYFYRFTLAISDGVVPAHRDPKSQDLRYLGVFLGFPGAP
ncbi:MAG TPA: hypothetical protein VHR45_02420 [Thermoanaerobaculia bacterium]|nr:hypothetical protein [Thermoanaerobaculia bacterium]